jgi:pimeloyl-ACP methyl ester carboxylesterase
MRILKKRRHRLLGAVAGVAALSGTRALVDYRRSIRSARARVAGRTAIVPSRYGDIEYSWGGVGPDVLVVHGAGGGFDQGELIAETLLGERFHFIAPSRFGYLRSTFRPGATFDDQAHAFAALLDHLRIDRVAVLALSAGGPSAALLALLHPERVSSLTLLSCGIVPGSSEDHRKADRMGRALLAIFRRDYRYWVMSRLLQRPLLRLIGLDQAVVARLSPEQRRLAQRFLDSMNPASLRYPGASLDHAQALPGARITGIRTPTLVLHAADDRLQPFHNATFAAANIPGARLVRFEQGGHFLLGVERETVAAEIRKHILEHAGEQRARSA